jgi:putative transposase
MTLAQEGKVAQRNRYDLVIRRESSRPNEIWQADHCWLGIWVFDEDGQAVRPWLTVVLDDYSRAIAGYRVTVSAPTALHSALTLRQAMLPKEHVQWPVYGVPQMLYTDHGKDLTSAHLEQVAAELKMQVLYSKIGQPRGRGKIERFMATVDEVLLQRLPGYSPKRKDQWPAEREDWEEKRRREARLSVREFARCFEEWVVQEYHQRRQRDLGGSPIERWEQGGFVPWLPEPREQLDLLLLTVPRERKVRPEGIAFEGYWYRHTTLTAYVGEQVVIRYEPADMAEIRVYFERRFLCRAICEELGGEHISLHDLEQARKELRSRERGQVRERKKVVKRMGRPMEMERRAQEEERRTSQCEPSDQVAREILKRYEHDE